MQSEASKNEDKNIQRVCTLQSTMDAVLVMDTEICQQS